MKSIVALLSFLTLFSLNTFAQDYTRWHLPDGTRARFGKGWIRELAYSPDGTRLAVASSIGIWLYDIATGQEVALLTGHSDLVSLASRTVRMAALSHRRVMIGPSVSGMQKRGHTSVRL